jgi:Fe-S-cluster containining protein
MPPLVQIENTDRRLLASIGDSTAEAARRSGEWLVCRPGCTQCCMAPFAITQLDAYRLREGLKALAASDPARAEAVRSRAEAYVLTASPVYPGDPASGALWDEDSLPASLDGLPCPALDLQTGTCDLYAARPITCRTFGPILHTGERVLGPCELCYTGATDQQMLECAVEVDPEGLETDILDALAAKGAIGITIVAYALVSIRRAPGDGGV